MYRYLMNLQNDAGRREVMESIKSVFKENMHTYTHDAMCSGRINRRLLWSQKATS